MKKLEQELKVLLKAQDYQPTKERELRINDLRLRIEEIRNQSKIHLKCINGIQNIHLPDGNYMLDAIDVFKPILLKHDKVLIIGGTGIGKSTSIYKGDQNIGSLLNNKVTLEKNAPCITIMVVPTNLKLQMDNQKHGIPIFYGKTLIDETSPNNKKLSTDQIYHQIIKSKSGVIATNYSNLSRIISSLEQGNLYYNIILDEAHNLYSHNKQSFKRPCYQIINKSLSKAIYLQNIVYLSATFEPCFVKGFEIVKINKQTELQVDATVTRYHKKYDKYLIEDVKRYLRSNTLMLIYINNKKDISKLKTAILEVGEKEGLDIASDDIIIMSKDHQNEDYFKRIINTGVGYESFNENIKIVFCTSIIEDAIDLYTDRPNIKIQILSDETRFDSSGTKQFIGRIRNNRKVKFKLYVKEYTSKRHRELYENAFAFEFEPHQINILLQETFDYYDSQIQKNIDDKIEAYQALNRRLSKSLADNPDYANNSNEYYQNKIKNLKEELFNQWEVGALTRSEMQNLHIGIDNIIPELKRVFGQKISINEHLVDELSDEEDELFFDEFILEGRYEYCWFLDDNNEWVRKVRIGGTEETYSAQKNQKIISNVLANIIYEIYVDNPTITLSYLASITNNNTIIDAKIKADDATNLTQRIELKLKQVLPLEVFEMFDFRFCKYFFNEFLERYRHIRLSAWGKVNLLSDIEILPLIFSVKKIADGEERLEISFYENKHYKNYTGKLNTYLFVNLVNKQLDDNLKIFNAIYDLDRSIKCRVEFTKLLNLFKADEKYKKEEICQKIRNSYNDIYEVNKNNDKFYFDLFKSIFSHKRYGKKAHSIKVIGLNCFQDQLLKRVDVDARSIFNKIYNNYKLKI